MRQSSDPYIIKHRRFKLCLLGHLIYDRIDIPSTSSTFHLFTYIYIFINIFICLILLIYYNYALPYCFAISQCFSNNRTNFSELMLTYTSLN